MSRDTISHVGEGVVAVVQGGLVTTFKYSVAESNEDWWSTCFFLFYSVQRSRPLREDLLTKLNLPGKTPHTCLLGESISY